MPERIHKLQPDRTVHLRGFDTFAAAATIHSASPAGFKVSGTFRDPADFTVAVLYDADNFYEHPSIKYLPNFDFSGLTLNFNLHYTGGLQPIDSPKFNWIDWATLDCIRADGSTAQTRLWDNATLVDASFPAASATLNVQSSGIPSSADRITLWYQNLAFDYSPPQGQSSVEFRFFFGGKGTVHSITVNGRTYSHTEPNPDTETGASQAAALVSQMGGDLYVSASIGSVSNAVLLTVRPSAAGAAISVSASDGNGAATMRLTTPAVAAASLAALMNSTNWISANTTHALLASHTGAQVQVTAARYGAVAVSGTSVSWLSGHLFPGLTPGATILIAGIPYTVASVQTPSQLTLISPAPGASAAPYVAPRGGRDGNMIQLYATNRNPTLTLDQAQVQLSGGSSDVTWNCTLDFTALGIDQLRQCWLTFAPSLLTDAFPATEWEAAFTNWQLTGPETIKTLSVAGAGSVRIEDSDSACVFTPSTPAAHAADGWIAEQGFYSKYFAKATSKADATLTVTYTCQFSHDLYIGTSLYSDRAVAGIRLDNDSETALNCYLATSSAIATRRIIRASVAPGRHTVFVRLQQPGVFYFDFLEAAVTSDFPDALTPRPHISPALDFDTDHTYKLSPARLMWIMDKLGYAGPMNEYLGVFWWNERVLSGGSLAAMQVSFTGTFSGTLPHPDTIFLNLGGAMLGKTVFTEDTPSTIAGHFAAFINGALVGVWAAADGPVLSIYSRSPAPAYSLAVAIAANSPGGQVGIAASTIQVTLAGTFAAGDTILLIVDGSQLLKTVSSADIQANDIVSGLAAWFAANIPGAFTGLSATATRGVFTATSSTPFVASVWAVSPRGPKGTPGSAFITRNGQYGKWLVDDTASPPINRATRDWHADFYAQCAARGRDVVTACSMELVNPPDGYVARFAGGAAVSTATGFGSLSSNHCAAGSTKLIAYQKSVYRNIAQMQADAGLTPYVQYGEFLWWFFAAVGGGMAFHDSETEAGALAALGRPLYPFTGPNDNPAVNGGADAVFLRNRLRDHVAALVADIRTAFPTVRCEVLWPYDVNYPVPQPVPQPADPPDLGGRLNRFVNLPAEWQQKASSGLDVMKVEALAFSATMRNLNLAREAIGLFPNFGWPLDSLRYLVPVFGPATPWHRELALAHAARIPNLNLWAFDHICLYNLDVPERGLERRSVILNA